MVQDAYAWAAHMKALAPMTAKQRREANRVFWAARGQRSEPTWRADALTFPTEGFDAIHASPPCQRYSAALNCIPGRAAEHPDLMADTRHVLMQSGLPYVIENVPGAPLLNPVTICGLALRLKLKRHRLFESNRLIFGTQCPSHDQDYYVIFGHECRDRRHGHAAGRKNKIAVGREVMGIPWMNRSELSQAIPPAYTEFIGRQLISQL